MTDHAILIIGMCVFAILFSILFAVYCIKKKIFELGFFTMLAFLLSILIIFSFQALQTTELVEKRDSFCQSQGFQDSRDTWFYGGEVQGYFDCFNWEQQCNPVGDCRNFAVGVKTFGYEKVKE